MMKTYWIPLLLLLIYLSHTPAYCVADTDKNNSILTTYWPNPFILTGNRWYIDNQMWHKSHTENMCRPLYQLDNTQTITTYSMVQYKRILNLTINSKLQTKFEHVQKSCGAHNDEKDRCQIHVDSKTSKLVPNNWQTNNRCGLTVQNYSWIRMYV